MALTKATQYANRFGIDWKVYSYPKVEGATALATIDYINEVAVDFSSNTVWATGGKFHSNKIPFADPIEGTVTLSTQIMTSELLALAAGKDMSTFSGNEIVFSNNDTPQFYVLEGTTSWKDKDGNVYAENVTCYKVAPDKAYNVTYTGEGDPNSMDITFNLLEDDDHNVYKSAVVASGDEDTTGDGE